MGPNLQQIMKQAQKMQQQLAAAQAELAEAEVTGTAGGGLVTVTMSGTGEVTAVKIDPKRGRPGGRRDVGGPRGRGAARRRGGAAQTDRAEDGPAHAGLAGMGGGLGLPGF